MLDLEVLPARAGEEELVVGEEVAVGLLAAGHEVLVFQEEALDGLVGARSQDAAGRVGPFMEVGVGIKESASLAFPEAREHAEIVDRAALLVPVPLVKDRAPSIQLEAGRPMGVLDRDSLRGDFGPGHRLSGRGDCSFAHRGHYYKPARRKGKRPLS